MKYSFLALMFLLSSPSYSAECLQFSNTSTSSSTGQEYVVYYQNHLPLEGCVEDVVLSPTEYATLSAQADSLNFLNSVTATLIDLFEFSVEDFAYFNAICLIGFISGHSIGRVLRLLGKT
jgi:hypothetical protein